MESKILSDAFGWLLEPTNYFQSFGPSFSFYATGSIEYQPAYSFEGDFYTVEDYDYERGLLTSLSLSHRGDGWTNATFTYDNQRNLLSVDSESYQTSLNGVYHYSLIDSSVSFQYDESGNTSVDIVSNLLYYVTSTDFLKSSTSIRSSKTYDDRGMILNWHSQSTSIDYTRQLKTEIYSPLVVREYELGNVFLDAGMGAPSIYNLNIVSGSEMSYMWDGIGYSNQASKINTISKELISPWWFKETNTTTYFDSFGERIAELKYTRDFSYSEESFEPYKTTSTFTIDEYADGIFEFYSYQERDFIAGSYVTLDSFTYGDRNDSYDRILIPLEESLIYTEVSSL